MSRLEKVIAAIDAANDADPDRSEGAPAARLYGERMSAELQRLFPGASEELQIAARGQHVERWILPRDSYPRDRQGYLAWRRALAEHHAQRVAEIMRAAGYPEDSISHVQKMLRKEGIKRDPDVQALEDVICFVFLRWYFEPFAKDKDPEDLRRIVSRTARKMSAAARERVLREFDLPPDLAACFSE